VSRPVQNARPRARARCDALARGPPLRSDPCESLKPDTHDENGKPYVEKGKPYVVPKVVFSPEWLIESPPPAHTWEEPPIFYDVEGEEPPKH